MRSAKVWRVRSTDRWGADGLLDQPGQVAVDGDAGVGSSPGKAADTRRQLLLAATGHLRVALVPWVTARVIVIGMVFFNDWLAVRVHGTITLHAPRFAQLSLWDGGWYESIARLGYAGSPPGGLRFFPLYPLLGRVLIFVGFSPRPALLAVANGFALVLGAQVHALVLRETQDPLTARRAAWLIALVPPAYIMVMAYSEPVAIAAAVATFMALRSRRWWWAALFGLAAGLARPTGLLLAIPALVEVLRGMGLRGIWQAPRRDLVGRVAAVAGAPVGTALYLAWVGLRFGHPLQPYTSQVTPAFRGHLVDPLRTIWRAFEQVAQGNLGSYFIYLTIVIAVVLIVVCFFQWPVSYGLFAVAVFLEPLTGSVLDGVGRYAFNAFPVVLTLARLTRRPSLGAATVVVGGLLMAVLFLLQAFFLYP